MTASPSASCSSRTSPGHAELARRAFEDRRGRLRRRRWPRRSTRPARALHGATPPDLVIADWLLPDGEGLDLLRGESARGDAAGRDHDEPRQRARRRRGDPRRRRRLRREERGRPRRPAAHGRARRAPAAGRGGARRPRRGHGGDRGRGPLRRARAAPGADAAGEVRLGGRARRTGTRLRTLARFVDGRLAGERRVRARGHARARASSTAACATSATASPSATRRTRACAGMGAQSYVGAALRASSGERPRARQRHPRPAARRGRAARDRRCRSSRRARRPSSSGCGPSASSSASACSPTACSTWSPRSSSSSTPTAAIVRFNRACEQTSGWSEAELRGRAFWEVLRPRRDAARGRRATTGGGRSALELPRPTRASG